MKTRFILLSAFVILSYIAEKCKQLTESDGEPRKERFTFANCFDMKYGTMICVSKLIVRIFFYQLRARRVQSIREAETRKSFAENLSKGQSLDDGLKLAREVGNKRAKRARLEIMHIITPLMSSGWDLYEVLYVGGTLGEGLARSIGEFLGAYSGGLAGEEDAGWFGFQVGSLLGGWFGERMGLMAYDIGNGVLKLMGEFNSLPIA